MSGGPDSAPPPAPGPLPAPDDVRRAAGRLAGWAVETPLLRADALDEQIGGRLLLKAEPLQRTGSFKFRGAFNRLSQLEGAARAGGGGGLFLGQSRPGGRRRSRPSCTCLRSSSCRATRRR